MSYRWNCANPACEKSTRGPYGDKWLRNEHWVVCSMLCNDTMNRLRGTAHKAVTFSEYVHGRLANDIHNRFSKAGERENDDA